jgi:hypothetical protein
VTAFVQPPNWQFIVHVFCAVEQVVQPGGQPAVWASPRGASPIGLGASIDPVSTQNPLSQKRPAPHGVVSSHLN